MRHVSHLESAIDGTRFPPDHPHTMHEGRPLWVRYHLDAVRERLGSRPLDDRADTSWAHWRALLPTGDVIEPVTLAEQPTPILDVTGVIPGIPGLLIKDESRLPTGSFKARGMAMAITMARHFGLGRVAVPTNGNAGGALAAYAARAGLEAFIFMPRDTPGAIQLECLRHGARVFLVDGLITDCGRITRAGADAGMWFDLATLKEPYRIEGKKTMGLELAAQLRPLPAGPITIIYPTGGGTGLIGIWKAFTELAAMEILDADQRPRMVAVQSSGCAPIVRAFEAGERFATPWERPRSTAWGIRVPAAIGDFMILDAIGESRGCAIAVPEREIIPAMERSSAATGIGFCEEGAACMLAAERLRDAGWFAEREHAVVINTCSPLKYLDASVPDLPVLPADATIESVHALLEP